MTYDHTGSYYQCTDKPAWYDNPVTIDTQDRHDDIYTWERMQSKHGGIVLKRANEYPVLP